MYESKIDIAVALIFFNRPTTLSKVFAQIKKARPSKLFLIQDGARKGNLNDVDQIEKCRNIVSEIDWNCEIFKNYSNENLGCGSRPFTGVSWVFENVDRAIILEDDCVPSDSFFSFCKEMLDKYENDFRVGIISGLNYFENYDFGGKSYGFVKSGSIWGWATWRNRWNKYDYKMTLIEDDYVIRLLKSDITPNTAAKKRIDTWIESHQEINEKTVVSYWDYQWGFVRHCNSWLSIVPKYNQISNIGIGFDSTHSGNSIKMLPKKVAKFFFMKTTNLEFPLTHPDYIIPNRQYDSDYYNIVYPNIFKKIISSINFKIKYILNKISKK